MHGEVYSKKRFTLVVLWWCQWKSSRTSGFEQNWSFFERSLCRSSDERRWLSYKVYFFAASPLVGSEKPRVRGCQELASMWRNSDYVAIDGNAIITNTLIDSRRFLSILFFWVLDKCIEQHFFSLKWTLFLKQRRMLAIKQQVLCICGQVTRTKYDSFSCFGVILSSEPHVLFLVPRMGE